METGQRLSMGRYSCPNCSEDVAPVQLGANSGGRIIGPRADGLLIERKVCPTCGARLERTPLDRWHRTGSLAAARSLEIVEPR
jgi:ribosomal protein S27AE